MQVEVTGGRLLISSEERGSPAAALQRRRDLMSVFDVRQILHLLPDDAVYRARCCPTSTNALRYYVGNQYLASLA